MNTRISDQQKTLLLSDVHVPYQDNNAVKQALECGKKFKPSVVILNGDIVDFHAISRFLKDPKKRNLKKEIDETREFLDTVRKTFKDARLFYRVGNHEKRLTAFLWQKAEEFSDLPELSLSSLLQLKKNRITLVEEEELLTVGKLTVVHGQEVKGVCSVYPARGLYMSGKTSAIAGHCHRASSYVCRSLTGELFKTYTVGCLCQLQADYSIYNDWIHGCGLIETDTKGNFEVTLKAFG